MKKRYTEQQIAYALKQVETGTRIEEVTRHMGISHATFYNWKKRFGAITAILAIERIFSYQYIQYPIFIYFIGIVSNYLSLEIEDCKFRKMGEYLEHQIKTGLHMTQLQ